jgi:hypothetical protein
VTTVEAAPALQRTGTCGAIDLGATGGERGVAPTGATPKSTPLQAVKTAVSQRGEKSVFGGIRGKEQHSDTSI